MSARSTLGILAFVGLLAVVSGVIRIEAQQASRDATEQARALAARAAATPADGGRRSARAAPIQGARAPHLRESLAGELRDGRYVNAHFGLSLPVPSAWVVHDHRARQRMLAAGVEGLSSGGASSGPDTRREASPRAEPELVAGHVLLALSRHPIDAPARSNPTLVITAEALPRTGRQVQAAEFLVGLAMVLRESGLRYRVLDGPREVWIAGRAWSRMEVRLSIGATAVTQVSLAAIRGEHALHVGLSATQPSDIARLVTLLDALEIDPAVWPAAPASQSSGSQPLPR